MFNGTFSTWSLVVFFHLFVTLISGFWLMNYLLEGVFKPQSCVCVCLFVFVCVH